MGWADVIGRIRAIRPGVFMLSESADLSLLDAGFDMAYDYLIYGK